MADSCCAREVDIQRLEARQRRVLCQVFMINVATFGLLLVAALYSQSSALLSGGLDNLGDAVTYAISLAVVGAKAQTKRRVALFKGGLIFAAALGVAVQLIWHVLHPSVPLFAVMSGAALVNLCADCLCLYLLMPYRHGEVNMASTWICSRNDVCAGIAVILAALSTKLWQVSWPDLLIAAALLALFIRAAWQVWRQAWQR